MEPTAAAELFREEALSLGFVRIGFTPVGPVERHDVYQAWLARGYAGEMGYLARDAQLRSDPRALFAGARTVVTVALSYAHPDPIDVPADRLAGGPRGRIARYARGADYHFVLKNQLRALAAAVARRLGRAIAFQACVDTAPVLEREAAQAGGLGFIAKNTLLIAPGAGSYLVLGELLTDVECAPAAAIAPRCGQCRACLDACPTGAFVDAYTLDARRCISYLTIELTGAIPRELRPLVGDHVFGCDVCQEVCPFNASASNSTAKNDAIASNDLAVEDAAASNSPATLTPRPGYGRPALRRLLGLGAAQFRKWQKQSALRRIHRPQLLRNACVALGNTGDGDDLPSLAHALDEPHALARAHAAWAIGRIALRHPECRAAAEALLAARRALEEDPAVRAELDDAFVG
jgi:epoxyqueuosine reductase